MPHFPFDGEVGPARLTGLCWLHKERALATGFDRSAFFYDGCFLVNYFLARLSHPDPHCLFIGIDMFGVGGSWLMFPLI